MITDVHTHIWETPDQLGRGAARHIRRHVKQPWERPDASISAHESAMDPVQAVLVHGFESRYLGASVPAKQVAHHVARNPEKYIGFAGVDPLGDFKSQINEAKQLGLSGVTICPAGQGCHPSHSRAMKVYEICAASSMPIFVHPATHLGADAKLEFAQPYLFDEIAREFPTLRMVIGQIGYPWIDQGLTLIGKHEHVYAELSNVVSRPWQLYNTLLTAYQLDVTDHLLFGSDYPFCTPEKAISTIYSVNTLTQGTPLPSVPREKLRSIVERDVLQCLGLTDTGASTDAQEDEASDTDTSAFATVVAAPSGNGHDTGHAIDEPTVDESPIDATAATDHGVDELQTESTSDTDAASETAKEPATDPAPSQNPPESDTITSQENPAPAADSAEPQAMASPDVSDSVPSTEIDSSAATPRNAPSPTEADASGEPAKDEPAGQPTDQPAASADVGSGSLTVTPPPIPTDDAAPRDEPVTGAGDSTDEDEASENVSDTASPPNASAPSDTAPASDNAPFTDDASPRKEPDA